MLVLTFPTNYELDIVTQEYMIQRERLLGQSILPFQEYFTQKVRWDEKDSERGMTAPHAMDSDPRVDKRPGSVTREYEPIPFKETDLIKESELLKARELGTLAGAISLDRLVMDTMKARTDKTFIRAEWLIWQTLLGGFTINENGVKVVETFAVQTYDPAVAWDAHATAKPLADFNATKLLFRGTGASAMGAMAFFNQKTANDLLENTNADDIRGFRNQNFRDLPFSIEEANSIFAARGLPNLKVYDEGYIDENGNFQLYIPDDKVIIVGKRPSGQRIGEFAMCPSLHRQRNGQPAPGFFSFIEVNGGPNAGAASVSTADLGAGKNPKIEITGGVYGGTLLFYPRSIIVMDVS